MTATVTDRLLEPSLAPRSRPRPITVWAIVMAALALAVVSSASAFITYRQLHRPVNAYDAEIAPVVGSYNEIIQRWNAFADEVNGYAAPLSGPDDPRAADGLERIDRLVTDAQRVIAGWEAITPPPELEESHRLAGQAMRTTQGAFVEMSLYLDGFVNLGVAMPDRAGAASSKFQEASRLLEQARASARPVH